MRGAWPLPRASCTRPILCLHVKSARRTQVGWEGGRRDRGEGVGGGRRAQAARADGQGGVVALVLTLDRHAGSC